MTVGRYYARGTWISPLARYESNAQWPLHIKIRMKLRSFTLKNTPFVIRKRPLLKANSEKRSGDGRRA
jgi:hypothetical protein